MTFLIPKKNPGRPKVAEKKIKVYQRMGTDYRYGSQYEELLKNQKKPLLTIREIYKDKFLKYEKRNRFLLYK